MLTAISPQRAAQLYVQLYPLCEQAWRELGHPKSAFNDRLLAVIANLLQAPEPQGAVLLRQPKVLYTYADPALEAAPAGQKILMRMGLETSARSRTGCVSSVRICGRRCSLRQQRLRLRNEVAQRRLRVIAPPHQEHSVLACTSASGR
jgi:Protein of unknown function (DUF3014).